MELDPSGYPWTEPLPRSRPAWARLAGRRGRVPVVAVGSNASPTVLEGKLGRLLDRGLPMGTGAVDGLVVSHSAHVSTRGYVAAAPARAAGSSPVTVGWFDAEQLAALDATEPNYRRVRLATAPSCRLTLEGWRGGAVDAHVYVSVHGVLGERGRPVPFGGQTSVLGWISCHLPGIGGPLTHGRLLDPTLREQVRAGLVAADLVVPAWTPAGPRTGQMPSARGPVSGAV